MVPYWFELAIAHAETQRSAQQANYTTVELL